ncbi:hypothetical protein DKP78_19060, partial [Enterococcus faecium]
QVLGPDETSPVTASRVLVDATASASVALLRNQRQRILSSEQPFSTEMLLSSALRVVRGVREPEGAC